MIVVPLIQFFITFLILKWLLKQKSGEPFSRKTVMKLLLFGAVSVMLCLAISFVLPIERDTFFGMNPILSGFLTALITAALFEEIMKYLLFRLAIRKNGEVLCWHDAILAAVIVGMGFTLLEDLEFVIGGDASILRALVPGHLLFQAVMGYYYGKARVTKQFKYDVLSLAVPILLHTVLDMFIISLMSIVGDRAALDGLTEETIKTMPYGSYLVPTLFCVIAVLVLTLVALILMAVKISRWHKNGEKQELLKAENT